MNPIIISTIIASASLIISIFSANWLNQQHTKQLIDQIEKSFSSKIDGLQKEMNARFDAVSIRFDAVDRRFDGVDRRLGELEQRLGRLENILFKPSIR